LQTDVPIKKVKMVINVNKI